jgi:hypothetical protein
MSIRYLLVLLLWSTGTWAQEYPRPSVSFEEWVQQMANTTEGLSEDAFENWMQYFQQPLDLNRVTPEELAELFLLSSGQIEAFFRFRAEVGPLTSVYELQAVPLFDLPTIYRLLPFVYVRASSGLALDQAQHLLLWRFGRFLETQKGFTPPDSRSKTRYLGDPNRWYLRYKMHHARDFGLGFTLKQDTGEPFQWSPASQRYGPDFTSFHVQIQQKGILKNLLLGDYQLQVGQGLLLSGGFYLGKGAETILTVRRAHTGLRPYTGGAEWGFFRGAAATVQWGRWELTGMWSSLRRDANVIDDTTVSSLQTSGLHRTDSEIADKASLTERNVGLNLVFRSKNQQLLAGLTALQTSFDRFLQRQNRAYNRYEFAGRQQWLLGAHATYGWKNWSFFGEMGRSESGGMGWVAGAVSSLGKAWDVALLYRQYDPDFHSFYANSFAESSRNINEKGLYAGLKYQPKKAWQYSAYVDIFGADAWRFQVSGPSMGWGFLAQMMYQPQRQKRLWVQIRQERKQKDLPQTTPPQLANTLKRHLLVQWEQPLHTHWQWQSRLQASWFEHGALPSTQGWALIQDLSTQLRGWKLTARVAYFHTDDYENRQYAYENDVLYAFSFPAYAGHGLRHYLLASRSLSKHCTAYLRWSRTDLWNEDTFGSGLDEIAAPHRSEIKVQLRWHW